MKREWLGTAEWKAHSSEGLHWNTSRLEDLGFSVLRLNHCTLEPTKVVGFIQAKDPAMRSDYLHFTS